MADLSHAHSSLVWCCLPTDQFIFQVDLNHFAHQTICSTAHSGDLLQDGQTGFAGFQRTFQGVNLPTDAPAAAAASDAEALLPSGVGTGAVALLAVGWGVAGMFGTEARAQHGDTLHLRLRLQLRQPCRHLVVSYHIKNRQNQHILGGHSSDRPEVHGRAWQSGEVLELAFDIPVHLHQGDYALTVLAASMADVAHYTDAVFHLWADDVATLHVMPRAHFPLSDLIEPPQDLSVIPHAPWLVLDDFFPNLLTGFRVAEYNAHLAAFPQLSVLSSLGDFASQHARYAEHHPALAHRVRPFAPAWLAGAGLAACQPWRTGRQPRHGQPAALQPQVGGLAPASGRAHPAGRSGVCRLNCPQQEPGLHQAGAPGPGRHYAGRFGRAG